MKFINLYNGKKKAYSDLSFKINETDIKKEKKRIKYRKTLIVVEDEKEENDSE